MDPNRIARLAPALALTLLAPGVAAQGGRFRPSTQLVDYSGNEVIHNYAPCQIGIPYNGAGKPARPGIVHTGMFGGQVAVVTGNGSTPTPYAVSVVDLTDQASALLGWQSIVPYAWEPTIFHNEGQGLHEWNVTNLGTIFGLTLSPGGDIYVTAASCYILDEFPNGGTGGEIFRLDSVTGDISLVASLRNSGSGLGNITYDYLVNQLFVSNMEDGLIYRFVGGPNWTLSGTYDHGLIGRPAAGLNPIVEDFPAGFTPLGRRVWAVETHVSNTVFQFPSDHYKLFYGVWVEDRGARNPDDSNEIWSVMLDPLSGEILPSTARREIILPAFDNTLPLYSNPPADICFKPDGHMLVAERSMHGNSLPGAHASRLLEFRCNGGYWERELIGAADKNSANADIGGNAEPSCAGGVDSDYGPTTSFWDGRTWTTVDALHVPFPNVYGLAGIPPEGGDSNASNSTATCILVDLNATYGSSDKTALGDVEIPAPE